MELFWNTVAIVSGILSPLAVLILLIGFWAYGAALKSHMERIRALEMEKERKQPPYDSIEFSQPPNPTMITVRLVKDGEVVWEESYDKGSMS